MASEKQSTAKHTALDEKFIEMLDKLYERRDRAALAALRRGLGKAPGEAMEAYRYVAPFTGGMSSGQQEDAYHTVATLFGLYPSASRGGENWIDTNLGASLKELRGILRSEGVDKRFAALLNCRRDDLAHHLRHIVGLLESKNVAVNWLLLLRDISRWDDDERSVQRNWAKAFWREDQ